MSRWLPVSAILGVLIWAQWRASGVWVIGLLVGIQLLFTGWALVMLALAVRRWRQTLTPDLRARRRGSAPRPGAPPAFGNRARLPALARFPA